MAYVDHISVDGNQYDIQDKEAVSFAQAQTLTADQQAQAQENMGAASASDVDELKSAVNIQSLNIYTGQLSNGYVRPNDGEFIEGTTTKVTGYLPVSAVKYVVSANSGTKREMYLIAVFDSNKTVIAESAQKTGDGNQRSTGYFFLPANSAYVRVTYLNANVSDSNKLWLLDAVDYNPSITITKSLITNDGTALPFGDIDAATKSIGTISANVYDGNLTNGYVRPNDGEFVSGATTKVTNMIAVIPGMYVVSSYNGEKNEMYMIALFDANQNIIPELVQQSGDGKQRATGYYYIPDTCKYVRVTYVNANVHSENKLYTLPSVDYAPTNDLHKSLYGDSGAAIPIAEIVDTGKMVGYTESAFTKSHKFYRKKVVAMGDSVTNGQTWFDGAESYFGYRPVNKGVAGSTVSTVGSNGFCTDTRIATIPEDTELLLLMGGINDWISNVPLGDKSITNVDTATFYGAVNVLCQKLIARIPNAKIICMGATFGIYPNASTFDVSTGIYNNLGLCSLDYGQAFVDMCHLNGIEGFVIGYECGWNTINYTTYIDYDGAYLHPNAVGGARMAEVISCNID